MSHNQNQYGATPQTDEYGNPIHNTTTGHATGEHGGRGMYDTTGVGTGATGHGTTGVGTFGTTGHTGHQQEKLHRSSSSSSSEDDGQGGRRKKGLKDKIKEKLPGGHKDQHTPASLTGAPGCQHQGLAGEQNPEKKGIIGKIKEKLPGQHGQHE